MGIFSKKRYIPGLDQQAANRILGNVFDACNKEHNSVPLEVLESYSRYRRDRYLLQKIIIILVLIAFFLLPVLFIPPSLSLMQNPEDNSKYEVGVKSFLPVRRVTAVIDNHNISVYEIDDDLYSIEPTSNGILTITVTLVNNRSSEKQISVTNIDTTAPVLVSNNHDGKLFYLYFSDPDSGVDYEKISAVDASGQNVDPVAMDQETGCVTYAYPKDSLNIFIPDKAGNQLHLLVTLK